MNRRACEKREEKQSSDLQISVEFFLNFFILAPFECEILDNLTSKP